MTEEIQSSLEGTQGKFSNDMTGTEGSKINSGGSSLTPSAERMIRVMFRDPSFNEEVAKAILQQWKEYIKFRKQRTDVLWIYHKRSFQGEWLVGEQDKHGTAGRIRRRRPPGLCVQAQAVAVRTEAVATYVEPDHPTTSCSSWGSRSANRITASTSRGATKR
ncbi:hypothetical protein PI125_g25964 [Phytophthora idaei]|nr:hypothetical protein PI125_g25964 [Phytophthora idaei]